MDRSTNNRLPQHLSRRALLGRRVLTYTGHSASVDLRALAWSPDGRYLASGGSDQVVRVWDARTGQDLVTYYGHMDQQYQPPIYDVANPDEITAIAWSPHSTRLASSAFNGPVRMRPILERMRYRYRAGPRCHTP